MTREELVARRRALAAKLTPLTNAEKQLLRTVVNEEIARVKLDCSNPDDRLAAFFGALLGRAGFDPSTDKLGDLWGEA